MEGVAIVILLMVLLVGAVTFFIFFQFLSTVRENKKLFREIKEEIKYLRNKIDSLPPPSPKESLADKEDK